MKYVLIFILSLLVTLSHENEENCDHAGTLLYEDLGCKPVKKEGQACPIKYDCNFEVKNNTCRFRGRSIPVSQELSEEDTYAACDIGCKCEKTNQFECAALDCPEWLGSSIEYGCYRKYEVAQCCSVGEICPTESNPAAHCEVNGEKIMEGTQFYPKDTCLECVCKNDYKGKNEAPFCKRRMCAAQIHRSEKIHKYCAPHYDGEDEKSLCCPDAWVCPSSNVKTLSYNPKADTASDLTCKFGDKTMKLGERLEDEYEWYDGNAYKSTCECILPPLLTCRGSRSTPAPTSSTLGFEIGPIPIKDKL